MDSNTATTYKTGGGSAISVRTNLDSEPALASRRPNHGQGQGRGGDQLWHQPVQWDDGDTLCHAVLPAVLQVGRDDAGHTENAIQDHPPNRRAHYGQEGAVGSEHTRFYAAALSHIPPLSHAHPTHY